MKKIFFATMVLVWMFALTGCFHEHTFIEANCITPKTCAECGETDGEPFGHTWKIATCTTPETCEHCGETQGNALGHTWEAATCIWPETCSKCEMTRGEALGHSWENATCTSPKTCSRCSRTSGNSLGHSWKNATCTSPKICSKCNTTAGNSLGHAMSKGFCTRCDYSTLKLNDVLSAPIQDQYSVKLLCRDMHVYANQNFASYYNSADGLYLAWAAKNTSSKAIKYLTFTVAFYNSVGDPARDYITGQTSKTIRLIGPIEAGETFFYRKIVGYSSSCSLVKITNVTIEYMDGTKISGNYNRTTHHKPYRTSGVPEIYVAGYID